MEKKTNGKLIVGIVIAVLVAAAVITVLAVTGSFIGKDAAEQIAFKDAGVTPSFCKDDLEFDDGHYQYEIEFYVDGIEYEYIILAKDGTLRYRNSKGASGQHGEIIRHTQPQETAPPVQDATESSAAAPETVQPSSEQPPTTQQPSTNAAAGLSMEDAKAKALEDAGLTADAVTFTESKEDMDNGVQVYELVFRTADTEYDYEIAVADGSIRKRETEKLDANELGTPSQETIDHAKTIALSGAGLMDRQNDVVFTEENWETEGGKLIFDFEFYLDDMEYEYKVSEFGEVLESESHPKGH